MSTMHPRDVVQNLQDKFMGYCRDGRASMLRHILACRLGYRIDTRQHDDMPFRLACASGNVQTVRFMLQLQGVRFMDNRGALQDSFVMACECGFLEVVEELLRCTGGRRIDVAANNHEAFLEACVNDQVHVVQCLLELHDGRCAASRATLSVAFARCLRKRLYGVTRHLRRYMAADAHDVRQRKISLHRASTRPVHTFRSDASHATAVGAVPPLIRCEPQDPPVRVEVTAALQRSARMVVNALSPFRRVAAASNDFPSKPRPSLRITCAR